MKVPFLRFTRFALALPLCWALLTHAARAQDIDVKNPPQGVFFDRWYELYLGDNKIGRMHTTLSREEDRIRTATDTSLSITRLGAETKIEMVEKTLESLAGAPLEFSNVMKLGQIPMETHGRIEGNKVTVTTVQPIVKLETKQEYQIERIGLMAWGVLRASHEKGFEPGTRFDLELYVPSQRPDLSIPAEIAVGGDEMIDYRGEQVKARKVVTRLILDPNAGIHLETVTWIDPKTKEDLVSFVNMAGIEMRLVAVDADQAKKEFAAAEFLIDTLIPVNTAIDREKVRAVTYELSLKNARSGGLSLPETDTQKPTRVEESKQRLEVTRANHAALREAPAQTLAETMREFLDSNPFINSKDEEIVKMAQSVKAEGNDPVQVAEALTQFVHDFVKDKSFSTAFATASEVCRNPTGDCSEHAVLLAALGRARGLPSRLAVGLVYVPGFAGQKNIFGFHAWTQFWIKGRWADFDAAVHERECSPTRIALAVNSLKDASLPQLAMSMINVIGNLEIKVVEMKPPQGDKEGKAEEKENGK